MAVVALVAEPAVEAAFGLAHGDVARDAKVDFGEGPRTLLADEAGLRHPGGIPEVVRIDLAVGHHVPVTQPALPAHVDLHGEGWAAADGAAV